MFITCFFFYYVAHAQKVFAITDREKILIGEQIILQLKLEDVNPQRTALENWFTIPDSIPHIQIIDKGKLDTVNVNGLTTYIQKFTLTSFDSGRWSIAPMQLKLSDNTTGKQTILGTDSIYVDVLSVDVSGLQDYHPLKEIVDVKTKPDYFFIGMIILSVVVLGVLVWIFVKQFKKRKLQPIKPLYKATALEKAISKIKTLSQKNADTLSLARSFYTELNEICRDYFAEQLHIKASNITSDELMLATIVYLQDDKKRTAFFQLLRLTDAVKFAKYVPSQNQKEEAITNAISSLQHIDQQIKQIMQHDK